MTSKDTFAHYLATQNMPDPRTPEQKQWDQVAADLVRAHILIAMHSNEGNRHHNDNLKEALISIESAMDTLDTLSPFGKELIQ